MMPLTFNFIDYLAAKKSVDDRALNRNLLQRLADHLPATSPDNPLHVLEVAAGIGTMLERLLEWQILDNVTYTAIDLQPDYIAAAARRLPRWAKSRGFQVQPLTGSSFLFQRGSQRVTLKLETVDVFEFVRREQGQQQWDLLIAHAFLDLVNLPSLLPGLFALLKADGLAYFTINFDGETILLPAIDPAQDNALIELYHRLMDEPRIDGQPVGGSQTGRQLFRHITAAGAEIIDAGSSDWVVFPGPDGYPHQEAFFLHCIIDTIAAALHQNIAADIQPWLARRHAQIERHELVYIAHQLDFLGRIAPI